MRAMCRSTKHCTRRYPEYANLGKSVRSEFVVGLLTYQGDG